MKKQLILAEKPSVGRDIARVLNVTKKNNGYFESNNKIVTWALGHLVTLSTPEEYDKRYEKWNLEDLPIIPNKMKLSVIKSSRAQFNVVKELINRKDIDEIVIATDAGREGELVARLILTMSGSKKNLKRLWISSVTDKAIKEGFANLKPAEKYHNLYLSALSRAQADWLVGINGSRALTMKYNARLSCGRVQTPTLNLIKMREDEITSFVGKDYFKLKLIVNKMTFNYIDDNNSMTIYEEDKVNKILNDVKGGSIRIDDIEEKLKKKYPKELYDLTNLQRDANVRYGYSAKQTLDIMQNLYEKHKILTYPRTDSRYLTEDIVPTISERLKSMNTGSYRKYINEILTGKINASKNFVDDSKVSDHHAIIPTEQPLRIDELDDKEIKIYDLVAKRFLSNLMKPYEYKEIKIYASSSGHKFVARGTIDINPGYKAIDSFEDDEEENQKLYEIKKGDILKISDIKKSSQKTSPPAYFTEGSLLLAMENPQKFVKNISSQKASTLKETGGIGTVATRGDIIEKLYNTDLIENNGNYLRTTSKGRQLLELVPNKLKSPELTADWELKLKNIESGKLKDENFLKEIKEFSIANIEEIKNSNYQYKHENLTNIKCELCGKLMLKVNRKDKELLICQDTNCGNRKTLSIITNVRCPNCHKKLKLLMDNKNYICETCGYRESKDNMDKKFAENKNKMKKSEVKRYLSKQSDDEINNSLAAKLSGLKFGEK
ncbi:DNA topoisomerase III [Peptoniphilus sp. oral taxon 386]|uniref:DNA topoisomerase III n=1 Tax=Peptoniphilus sp. oral taxon 386 TaxID=652713 RepID=UPI0001DAA472|nr:DNA topoisomerase III [Peptoniphilus sp. oral taxon 386]EFI41355.1 DNA topoisomerase [Peptoniphilus sp. oral taxon 386 str. F0131]